jgi:hypothetical protein
MLMTNALPSGLVVVLSGRGSPGADEVPPWHVHQLWSFALSLRFHPNFITLTVSVVIYNCPTQGTDKGNEPQSPAITSAFDPLLGSE